MNLVQEHTENTQEKGLVCLDLTKFLGESCSHQTILIILNNKHLQFLILFDFFKGENKKTDEPQKAEANKKEEPIAKQQGQ